MIKVEIYDRLIPMLEQMKTRSLGLVAESLQVSGALVAKHARAEMLKMSTHWHNAFIDGEYKEWRDPAKAKRLGIMMSHKQPGKHAPGSIHRMISFYLSPNQRTVTIGGTHPYFVPVSYKDGIRVGTYGEAVKAVGYYGRAIIHKLNTGQVTSEHPYSGTERASRGFVKNRNFMEAGFAAARGDIDKSLGERFERGFTVAVNNLNVKPIKRKLG